jgi:ubiquinone/menaquinone biosynthesis C-methylase UbiE
MSNFYDKVAKKFGGYGFSSNKPKYISKFSNGDPEKIFEEKLKDIAEPSLLALDIGCGDGKLSFKVSDRFLKIIGLDNSSELLKIAKKKKIEFRIQNVSFVLGEADNTPFDNSSFDVIFNRRGPSYYQEYYRLLKGGGCYLEVGIGEKDAIELKKVFGHGQNYGKWDKTRSESDKSEFVQIGFKPLLVKNFFYKEYYLSKTDFESFLEGVPIFEDFDREKDKPLLEKYYSEYTNGGNILLNRHRVVYLVKK